MMSGIGVDISDLPGELQRELLQCRHNRELAAFLAAEQEQAALAAELQAVSRDRRSLEGIGQPVLELNPVAFHYWGQRFGTYDCWHDRGFLREFARDNPAARVKAGGTKTQVGYQGVEGSRLSGFQVEEGNGKPPEGGTPYRGRFRKSYGERAGEAAIRR